MALLAKRNSGKGCFLKYLVSAVKHRFKKIVIFPTEKMDLFYSYIVDDDCIFNNFNEKWIKKNWYNDRNKFK